jgi:hypothetical protein
MLNETTEERDFYLISDLIDQLAEHHANGDEVLMMIVNEKIKDLTSVLESEASVHNYRYSA